MDTLAQRHGDCGISLQRLEVVRTWIMACLSECLSKNQIRVKLFVSSGKRAIHISQQLYAVGIRSRVIQESEGGAHDSREGFCPLMGWIMVAVIDYHCSDAVVDLPLCSFNLWIDHPPVADLIFSRRFYKRAGDMLRFPYWNLRDFSIIRRLHSLSSDGGRDIMAANSSSQPIIPDVLVNQHQRLRHETFPMLIEMSMSAKATWIKDWLRLTWYISTRDDESRVMLLVNDVAAAFYVLQIANTVNWKNIAVLHTSQTEAAQSAAINDFNRGLSRLIVVTHSHPLANMLHGFTKSRVIWYDFPERWQEIYEQQYFANARDVIICGVRTNREEVRIANMAAECLQGMNAVPQCIAQWLSSVRMQNFPTTDYFWELLQTQYPEFSKSDENNVPASNDDESDDDDESSTTNDTQGDAAMQQEI